MAFVVALAGWLYANVLGNIVASALWAWPALVWHHHRHVRTVRALHGRINDLHAKVDQQQTTQEGRTP